MKNAVLAATLSSIAALLALPGQAAEVTMTIAPAKIVRHIPPGALAGGDVETADDLSWAPGAIRTNAEHRAYIDRLAQKARLRCGRPDLRAISAGPGRVVFHLGRELENSAKPWSQRPEDCAHRASKPGIGLVKTVVGVRRLMHLAERWNLEALTVAGATRGPGWHESALGPELFYTRL
ncbi:MAG: hypothetical protein R3D62_16570 [Xanthobacteraceae bacterium]